MKTRSVFVMGVTLGVAIGTMLSGLIGSNSATAQLAPLQPPRAPQQQQPTILLDERRQELVYANGFRLFNSSEEVIADMGFNMPNPTQTAANMPGLLFDVRMRLVMSFATAKRFQEGLAEVVRRYETAYGEIRTTPPTPLPATQPSTPGGLAPR